MKIAFTFIQNISVLPVLVAVINSAAFYKLQNEKINIAGICVLGIICWIVYIYDGLKDITLHPTESQSSRHQFILKNQFNLSVLLIALGTIVLVLLFFQNKSLLYFGAFTGLLLVLYLFLIQKKSYFRMRKEFLMPLVFTIAVCGVPLAQKSSINLSSWVLSIFFLILCLQNAFLTSWFENRNRHKTVNIYVEISSKAGIRVVNFSMVFLILCFVIFFANGQEFKNGLALMYMIAGMLVSFSATKADFMQKKYNTILDALLLLPFFLILFF